jgi:uncharacterized membrane protein
MSRNLLLPDKSPRVFVSNLITGTKLTDRRTVPCSFKKIEKEFVRFKQQSNTALVVLMMKIYELPGCLHKITARFIKNWLLA